MLKQKCGSDIKVYNVQKKKGFENLKIEPGIEENQVSSYEEVKCTQKRRGFIGMIPLVNQAIPEGTDDELL